MCIKSVCSVKNKYLEPEKIILILLGIIIFVFFIPGKVYAYTGFPTPDDVLQDYKNNPYVRFYEGGQGVAWTTIHPGGYAVNSSGAYMDTGSQSYYRGEEGLQVIPEGVVHRKGFIDVLEPGQHYYAEPISETVVPVGKWVLEHPKGQCIHGPFAAGRDYEYYGIFGLSNSKCGEPYDSGWRGYCADCGEKIAGYVYTSMDSIKRTGYIFVGGEDFRKKYPVEYVFVCPDCGDNLEVSSNLSSHMCKSFVSFNRYNICFDPNGASSGEMDQVVFYYGGAKAYEGEEVTCPDRLPDNEYINRGYIFCGWSDTPGGQKIFDNGASRESIENYFTSLSMSGEGSDDQVKTLYAVWEKCDSVFKISAGSFEENKGYYDGVPDGTFEEGKNYFEKGYMHETKVDDGKLTHPGGYRIVLHTLDGERIMYADTELIGWRLESTYTDAAAYDGDGHGLLISGKISGRLTELNSDGSFTYLYSSPYNGCTDQVTAIWKSTSFTLPYGDGEGMLFTGWYSSPDLSDEHFVGKADEIIIPSSDIHLYASYKGISLIAEPNYMGSDVFGALKYDGITDLSVEEKEKDLIYKYYYSDSPYGGWKEAVTEEHAYSASGKENEFLEGGRDYEYTAPVTGIYGIKLWGGSGASYGDYSGENGEYSECEFFLYKGDRVKIHTGAGGRAVTDSTGIVCEGGEGSEVYINDTFVMSSAGGDGVTFVLNVNKRFNYTGTIQTFTAIAEADYKLQVWGAKGGPYSSSLDVSGNGGYAEGTVHLQSGDVVYVCVGARNGYNGGGSGGSSAYGSRGGCGGGATHMASENGLLYTLSGKKSSVYLVAGGGGGSSAAGSSSGYGGGYTGGDGKSDWPGGKSTVYGGTQTEAGAGYRNSPGGFGYGGGGRSYTDDDHESAGICNGGGGGGWYGGGGGNVGYNSYGCGGAGGSGYIGGVQNGSMSSGVCTGNGYANISCSINIFGEDRYGVDTLFSPGDLLYRNHSVCSEDEVIYPANQGEKSGACIITEPLVRYYESSDCSIYTPDISAPDPVLDARLIYEKNTGNVRVVWSMPYDKGTDYYYMARAFRLSEVIEDQAGGSGSMIEHLMITTGTYCYYYLIDESISRDAEYVFQNGIRLMNAWSGISGTSKDAYFTEWYKNASNADKESDEVVFKPDGEDRYIHIVAVDRAGNISDVFDMAVDGKKAAIPYPPVTEKLTIFQSENVYRLPNEVDTYYVRADGKTTFTLGYGAHLEGPARNTYQIEEARICISGSEYSAFGFERNDTSEDEICPDLAGYSRTSAYPFIPSVPENALRTLNGSRLSFDSVFLTSSEEEYDVYPRAVAFLEKDLYGGKNGERAVYSDIGNDRENGIRIIGDHTTPECMVSVNGGEFIRLSECNISNVVNESVIDRRRDRVDIDLYIFDDGAGIKDGFTIKVINTDNGYESEFRSDDSHFTMQLKMDSEAEDPLFENMLYNGEFYISVSSEDNVGNILSTHSAGIVELDASCEIIRVLDEISGPVYDINGNRCMKAGESGKVSSKIWGYPDAVRVSFDDESLKQYDELYICSDDYNVDLNEEAAVVYTASPEYLLELETGFIIPLDSNLQEISVTVTAYKNDESVTWHTRMGIVAAGSVLDELYSVLR